MADVMTSSSGVYETEANNGNAVTYITSVGMSSAQILTADRNVYVASGTFISRYGNRFDDVRYYTGDSAS